MSILLLKQKWNLATKAWNSSSSTVTFSHHGVCFQHCRALWLPAAGIHSTRFIPCRSATVFHLLENSVLRHVRMFRELNPQSNIFISYCSSISNFHLSCSLPQLVWAMAISKHMTREKFWTDLQLLDANWICWILTVCQLGKHKNIYLHVSVPLVCHQCIESLNTEKWSLRQCSFGSLQWWNWMHGVLPRPWWSCELSL